MSNLRSYSRRWRCVRESVLPSAPLLFHPDLAEVPPLGCRNIFVVPQLWDVLCDPTRDRWQIGLWSCAVVD